MIRDGEGAWPDDVKARGLHLQEHLVNRAASASPEKPITKASQLLSHLRTRLWKSVEHDPPLLQNSSNELFDRLKLLPPGKALAPAIEGQLRAVSALGSRFVLLGGGIPQSTNFKRSRDVPHFVRPDGAWFEFRFIVEEPGKGAPLLVLAYSCEIRFDTTDRPGPPWLRFDLNLPGHDNAAGGLRSHLHPGTEDWSLPAPRLTPDEALDMMLWHTCGRRDPRQPT